ncbi:MAG: hypothetical protein CVU05_04870 [Bacteroidetes bacterium HGW-Bacteroidetes-21]|jgi:hypothetical protein|nr:MAG: hypothetical protein CVU05_04870 [Bacteroidetes bacterium HGW-Bacteroidetes-21]
MEQENKKKAIRTLWIMFGIVIILIIAIYGVLFDSLSETEMIKLSYLWIGPLFFSIIGLIAAYNGAKKPMLIGLIGLFLAPVLLFLFFGIFWSML